MINAEITSRTVRPSKEAISKTRKISRRPPREEVMTFPSNSSLGGRKKASALACAAGYTSKNEGVAISIPLSPIQPHSAISSPFCSNAKLTLDRRQSRLDEVSALPLIKDSTPFSTLRLVKLEKRMRNCY